MSEHQHDVFISYARADAKDFAGRLAESLRHHEIDAWLDTAEIEGGAEWLRSLEQGISACKVFLAVRSPGGRQSPWVRRERLYALDKRKPIVPILRLDCDTDLELIDRQPVDFRASFEQALPQLVERIAALGNGHAPEAQDRRTLELAYLGRILLEHSIWKDLYTPMAGVAQMQEECDRDDQPAIEIAATPIDALFGAFWEEQKHQPREQITRQKQYTDILPAVEDMRQLVVLGDPGCGKTTTLWRIAADYAERAKTTPAVPLPVFVRLGALRPDQSLEAHILAQLGELGLHYHALWGEKRLALLLDGLNELPAQNRADKAQQIKALVESCQKNKMVAVVTCRELDYVGDLRLDLPQRVTIEPLEPIRIQAFVKNYVKNPPEASDKLFWQLAGENAQKRWQEFVKAVGNDPQTFWLGDKLSKGEKWLWWDVWREERAHPRSMLTLAQTPYMLYMMTQVFTREGQLPQNRGRLFQRFVGFLLLKREHLTQVDAEALQTKLAVLAYSMQAKGKVGTSVSRAEALRFLGDEQTLYWAQSASILGGTDEIRFTHQLLQEYFAAHKLDAEMQAGTPAVQFWPPDEWWEPQGWEETAILLAGLYNDDCTPVITWLRDANPELAGRCVLESGAHTPDSTLNALRSHYASRVIGNEKVESRARVGHLLGRIGDPRPGVLAFGGVPQFVWCEVPAGKFKMGGDLAAYNQWKGAEFGLPYSFWMAKYPVTCAQYEPFVAATGRKPADYWNDPQWHIANHPVVGVTWDDAYAYTLWLNQQKIIKPTGAPGNYIIRLPRECEWEKAARYPDGRLFPWGNDWDSARLNSRKGGIGRTSAVGIFPNGANPAHGACDLSGNVWEWCLTEWAKEYTSPQAENNDPQGDALRVARGGSWDSDGDLARAAARLWVDPIRLRYYRGFRVVLSASL